MATLRRIAKWTAIVLIGLAALIAIVLIGLNTGPGRGFVARQVAAYETASGMRFRVERIEGSLYGRMRLVGLSVSDPKGVFLDADAMTLDWRPFAYVTRNLVDVRELAAGRVTLRRAPALKPTPTDPNAPLLPDIDIAIGRLTVDRLAIEPAVTGRRHIVRLAGSADIADGRARITTDAAALAAPGVAGGDRLTLRLDAVPAANRLLIDGRLTAPAGGLVDSYAGLGKPIVATIGGRGDWARWDGRLDATLGGAPLADLAVAARDGRFRLVGAVTPGAMGAGSIERLTAPRLAIEMDATLAQRRVEVMLNASSDALALEAAGLIDLGQSRFGNFRLAGLLRRPAAIAENAAGDDVRLTAMLDGPFATPLIDYRLTARRLAFGTMGVERLSAQGRARIDADRILIPVAATAARVTGLNPAAGGLLQNVAVNGDLAWSNGRLLSDNLRLRSSRIDATAIVIADPAKGIYTGALKGRVNDYQVDGLGRISLTTDAELVPAANGGFGVRGTVRVVTRRIDNETLANALGGNAVTVARFGFDGDVARLASLSLTAPDFRIARGTGSYSLTTGRIAFSAAGASTQYGPLDVTASGTLERPLVRLRAGRPGVGIDLRDLVAEVHGTAAGYEVRAKGATAYGPLSGDVLVESGRGPLALTIRRATIAGIDTSGRLVATPAGPFAGRLALAGSGVTGSVRLSAAGADQAAAIDLTANAAHVPGDVPITIGRGRLIADAVLRPAGPSATGRFDLAAIRQGEMLVERAQGRIDYRNGAGTVALVANGSSGTPFSVAMQARLAPERIVANLRGRIAGIPLSLAAPAVATKSREGWTVAPVDLVTPQGSIRLSGRYGAETVARASLSNFDIAIVQAVLPGFGIGGKATGTLDYALPAGAVVPRVRARLDVTGLTRTAAFTVSDPLNVALLGTLDASGGDLRALIRNGGAIVGRLQARLAPLGPGAGLSERLMAAPLSGGIRYNGPAQLLWSLTGIADQDLTGPVALAADFGGRLDRPSLNGIVRANALRYENTTYGTVISNIALDGRFTRSEFLLNRLTGRAGEGTVSASGRVGLDAAGGFPMDLTATLARARLARSDALSATVTGTIAVTNGPGGGLIRGDIRVPEARYQIIRQGAAEVPELTGVRRRTDRPVQQVAAAAGPAPGNWRLDIRLRADNRIFVSGMGLEAEWATDMRIAGTASAPRVVGQLSVVRGTYSFAGRRFDLDERGVVRFDGGSLYNPELDISADTSVEGVTATVNIGGRAQNPRVTFTSTPALPQDEVLSRLLFGSSVTNLSPTQAIQLAAALNSLRGSGGGLNPLGKLRSVSGIDRLRVLGADKTAGRGTALAAGQYISNDIYVEVVTDARGFTATQLEISLSKALSLLSQAGSFGGSNVSLRYSKDY